MTLNKIASKNIEIISLIVNHPNFQKQVQEWKKLGDTFPQKEIIEQ